MATDLHSSRSPEKFSRAVEILCGGRGKIKERLVDACMEICRVNIELMPDGELKDEVVQLIERVTRIKDGGAGYIRATVTAMTEDDAVEIASLVLALDRQFSKGD